MAHVGRMRKQIVQKVVDEALCFSIPICLMVVLQSAFNVMYNAFPGK